MTAAPIVLPLRALLQRIPRRPLRRGPRRRLPRGAGRARRPVLYLSRAGGPPNLSDVSSLHWNRQRVALLSAVEHQELQRGGLARVLVIVHASRREAADSFPSISSSIVPSRM